METYLLDPSWMHDRDASPLCRLELGKQLSGLLANVDKVRDAGRKSVRDGTASRGDEVR